MTPFGTLRMHAGVDVGPLSAVRYRALTGHDPARPHAAHRLGPETRAMVTAILADTEVVGIVFSLGMFMPVIPPARLVAGW